MGISNEVTIELKDGLGSPLPVIAVDVGTSSAPVFIFASIPFDAVGNPLFTRDNPGVVANDDIVVSANFSTPNSNVTYASGQLVANSATAGLVVPMALPIARMLGGTGRIIKGRLTKSLTGVSNAIFRAHLYKDIPASIVNGDGGTWLTSDALTYLGSMTFDYTSTNSRVFTDGAKASVAPDVGADIIFDTEVTSNNIYALLEARSAYVRAVAETFTLALECQRN